MGVICRGGDRSERRRETILKENEVQQQQQQAEVIDKGKDIDFREQYGVSTKGDRFLNDKTTAGGTNAKKPQVRQSNIKKRLGYPLSRGPNELTGDTLLIKCLEYVAPKNGTGLGINFTKTTREVSQGGVLKGRAYKKGDTYTEYSNFRINANDANSRMSRNQKKKYFIHHNHTNPALNENSAASRNIIHNGFNTARPGMRFFF
mgnify:CR=1 FL=1